MSRELLERAGYDPDEQTEISAENVCGAAVLDIVVAWNGLPVSTAEIRSVIGSANEDLARAGIKPTVDQKMYDQVVSIIKASGILE